MRANSSPILPRKSEKVLPTVDPLDLPPSSLRRISTNLQAELDARGLRTIRDLLLHRPSRYEDRSSPGPIAHLKAGERGTILAEVKRIRQGRPRRGGRTLLCELSDASGRVSAVWFHARPWHRRELSAGARFFFTGVAKAGKTGGLVLFNPEYEELPEEPTGEAELPVHFGRQVPLYPGCRRPRAWRTLMADLVAKAVPTLVDPLPDSMRVQHGLLALRQALEELHFPVKSTDPAQLERGDSEAHRRLGFDEFLLLSLQLAQRRQGLRSRPGLALPIDPAGTERALRELPFTPTLAQRRAVEEITADLRSGQPMQRLLEGDVGSGKTAVAAVALRLTVESGGQGVLMAPTELLAEQHARSLQQLLGSSGLSLYLLTASNGGSRGEAARSLASGAPAIAVGTQALIQTATLLPRLALAVVDEQHRFGVQDRLRLMAKGISPHVLLMSATPIPRTLSLAVHGDLDLSILDELPPGRRPIATQLLSGKAQLQAVAALRREIAAGRQAYVVYPLIEESEKIDLQDATRGAEKLQAALPEARLALVHGRLSAAERETHMEAFRRGAIDVLVATTVIEVGVDVPNATLMIVAQAERFGLAQLHQLRGRVGRGDYPSQCYLLAGGPLSPAARRRLRALEKLSDGFRLAEIDLELRGAGEVLGTRQSGLPEFTFADPIRRPELLAAARQTAFALVESDPQLKAQESQALLRGLERLFGARRSLGSVG